MTNPKRASLDTAVSDYANMLESEPPMRTRPIPMNHQWVRKLKPVGDETGAVAHYISHRDHPTGDKIHTIHFVQYVKLDNRIKTMPRVMYTIPEYYDTKGLAEELADATAKFFGVCIERLDTTGV